MIIVKRLYMSYFPIFLDIKDKNILVVGGGSIAYQKLQKLLEFTKNITVIAKEVKYDTYILIKDHCLTYFQREYKSGDINNFDIVVVATDDINIQEKIYKESRDKNILINSVDNKDYCDFIFPAFIKKGDLTITFSTNGASPAFSKAIKNYCNSHLPPNIEDFLEKMKKLREELPKGKERMQKFEEMVEEYFENNFN